MKYQLRVQFAYKVARILIKRGYHDHNKLFDYILGCDLHLHDADIRAIVHKAKAR